MTIKETIDLINKELANNVYGRSKIQVLLPPDTFHRFLKFIKFCIRNNPNERYRDADTDKLNKFNVRINGKKFYFYKKKI